MGVAKSKHHERPRELRRRVFLTARLRIDADWSDTAILNVSSRGLMIQSARPATPGTMIEVRRGDHVIVARVMWRDGRRLGLQADERLSVEEILSAGAARGLQLVASNGSRIERRRHRRDDHERSRMRGRNFEFVATIGVGAMFAVCAWGMAHQAFARPLATIEAALAG